MKLWGLHKGWKRHRQDTRPLQMWLHLNLYLSVLFVPSLHSYNFSRNFLGAAPFCAHHMASGYGNIYIYIPPPPHATTYHHHWPPPHSASCLGASAVFAAVDGWKSTTSTSCRVWWYHMCKWTISLLSNGANIPHAQVVVVTSCNPHW